MRLLICMFGRVAKNTVCTYALKESAMKNPEKMSERELRLEAMDTRHYAKRIPVMIDKLDAAIASGTDSLMMRVNLPSRLENDDEVL